MATNQPGALDAATDLFVVSNRATTLLNGGISNVDTTITVDDGSVFPSSGRFKVTIDNEIIDIASRAGNDLTVEARGAESTAAASHSDNAACAMQVTAGHYETLRDGIINTQEGYMRRPSVNDSQPSQGVRKFGPDSPEQQRLFNLRRGWTW